MTLAAALKYRGALAPDIDVQDAADIVYAIAGNGNIYLRLTRECGWTDARYADLIERTLVRVSLSEPGWVRRRL
ncbi:MAG: hypothetical protein QOC68_425 [Solirubrobacteraceae bacterium]|jgi:hypothetical protein|nr:hypothetical protein [Solirubrobacteraceae bacterium]